MATVKMISPPNEKGIEKMKRAIRWHNRLYRWGKNGRLVWIAALLLGGCYAGLGWLGLEIPWLAAGLGEINTMREMLRQGPSIWYLGGWGAVALGSLILCSNVAEKRRIDG